MHARRDDEPLARSSAILRSRPRKRRQRTTSWLGGWEGGRDSRASRCERGADVPPETQDGAKVVAAVANVDDAIELGGVGGEVAREFLTYRGVCFRES